MNTIMDLLVECRPLFVEETTAPWYTDAGRARAARELMDLDAALARGAPTVDTVLRAVVVAETSADSSSSRGLARRMRNAAQAAFPEAFRPQRRS